MSKHKSPLLPPIETAAAESASSSLHYPMPHPGQEMILNSPTRFRVVACGRRFGKTALGKLDLMLTALDGGHAWWVAPTYKMALDTWGDFLTLLEPLAARVDRSNRSITFPNGGQLTVQSGHEPERLRGSGLDSVVIDEAAFCPPEVWGVLRPALSDRLGRALFLSTPHGRNWFWTLFQRGLDPLYPDWESWQLPTRANPFIPAAEIAAARQELPERLFRVEYEAEFLEDAGSVFRGVLDCVSRETPTRKGGENIVFGVDWGRVNDYTAIAVLGASSRRLLALERFNKVGWAAQRNRLMLLAARWQPTTILAEANSIGGPNVEALQKEGLPVIPFTMTAASKTPLIDALALAIEEKSITLLNDPVLMGELYAYTLEALPGGGYRYSAPSGGHDDTVIALALALHAAGMSRVARTRAYA